MISKNCKRVRANRLFDGKQYHHDIVMTIQNGVISSLQKDSAHCDVFLDGLVAPGFVDLQVNDSGSISPSAFLATDHKANFVQLNQDYSVRSTWINGQCVFDTN